MAISKMKKIMIVSHQSESQALLQSIQDAGILEVLDAERSLVTKEWPELVEQWSRPRDLEDMISRLEKAIEFLKDYVPEKQLPSALKPRLVVDRQTYENAVADKKTIDTLEQSEAIAEDVEKTLSEIEHTENTLRNLQPWENLDSPVEEIRQFEKSGIIAGIIPQRQFDELCEQLDQLGAVLEVISETKVRKACVIACLKENFAEVQKTLRSADFEQANFDNMSSTVPELIEQNKDKLAKLNDKLANLKDQARQIAPQRINLQILCDHHQNLLSREKTYRASPSTDHAVLMEGWVREKDYPVLEKIVSQYPSSMVGLAEPGEDEEVPVEINNTKAIKPFEVITRLYGMPQYFELDPTVLLAPFFAIYFALCLTDAGYGLIIIAFCAFLIKKMQGDKKLLWLLGICSVFTLGAGALTGGWFGDAVQQFVPQLSGLRESMMWFDPLEKPMIFFALACGLGYFQIMVGLATGMIHNFIKKDFIAGICDHLTWLVMLNAIVVYGAGKMGAPIPPMVSKIAGFVALVPAVMILLFSERSGGIGARLGMGAYNLFSTIFYLGDVLSYLRLMALGMVTGGLAMAINVMAKTASDIPYGIGIAMAIVILVGGHLFNAAISGLSAFVHTIRLQFVEFFPKFLTGGGKHFTPLDNQYQHIYIDTKNKSKKAI